MILKISAGCLRKKIFLNFMTKTAVFIFFYFPTGKEEGEGLSEDKNPAALSSCANFPLIYPYCFPSIFLFLTFSNFFLLQFLEGEGELFRNSRGRGDYPEILGGGGHQCAPTITHCYTNIVFVKTQSPRNLCSRSTMRALTSTY